MTLRAKAEWILLGTTLIWGSTFAAQKIGLDDIPPLKLNAIRFLAASVILGVIMFRRIFPLDRPALVRGFVLGFLLFLGFAFQTYGLLMTTASKSSFITSMMVVFAPLLQFVIVRRPPTWGNAFGILVVCSGLWLLTSPGSAPLNTGDLLTLACAFVFGLYVVYLDIASRIVPPVRLTFVQLAVCTLLGWGSALAIGEGGMVFSQASVTAIAYLTLFATILTTLVQTRFQKDTTPTRAAIIFTIEPVFATGFAMLILGETIGPAGIAGGSLIIAGILVSELSDAVPGLRRPIGRYRASLVDELRGNGT